MKIKSMRKYFSKTVLSLSLAFTVSAAHALPTGFAAVTGGIVMVDYSANGQINVVMPAVANGSTTAHIINWSGFNLAPTDMVEFQGTPAAGAVAQPAGSMYVLNRISGPASSINGTVLVNNFNVPDMHVFLMNANGVVVGAQGHLNVMNGTATTLSTSTASVTDAQFLAGTLPTTQAVFCSMGPCSVPAMPATPTTIPVTAGGTPTTPFTTNMTAQEFITALQANWSFINWAALDAHPLFSGLGGLQQYITQNSCSANPTSQACGFMLVHLGMLLAAPQNASQYLLAGAGSGSGAGSSLGTALGPLVGAVPNLSSYVGLFTAAQSAAMTQMQTYLTQNPGVAQYAANTIAQAAPQAVGQTQAAMTQAVQQVQANGAPAQVAANAAPGVVGNVLAGASRGNLQNFMFGNTLRATVRGGVVRLGL